MFGVYKDKTATTQKYNASVTYPVLMTLQNTANEFLCYADDHKYKIERQIPVSTAA